MPNMERVFYLNILY